MLLTVRHLTKEATRDISCIFEDDKRLEFAQDQLKHNNYIRVADIEGRHAVESIDVWLEEAYKLTNSIDSAWYETNSSFVDVSVEALKGCRSTSIGDIVQIQGVSYMVASCGFLQIKG